MSETWSVQDFVVSPHCGDDSQSFLIQVTEGEKGVLRADAQRATHGKNFRQASE